MNKKNMKKFLPGRTPDVLMESGKGRGSDSDDEGIPVKGKGRGKKGKGKDKSKGRGKGKGKFNPTLVPTDIIDPLKLVWTPLPKDAPAKGSGRSNYRALRLETLHGWLHDIEVKRVSEEGGHVDNIHINMEDYALPAFTPSAKKSKDAPKRPREQSNILRKRESGKADHQPFHQPGGIKLLKNS